MGSLRSKNKNEQNAMQSSARVLQGSCLLTDGAWSPPLTLIGLSRCFGRVQGDNGVSTRRKEGVEDSVEIQLCSWKDAAGNAGAITLSSQSVVGWRWLRSFGN
eukprot:Gb_04799 [translate_table: standard]